MAYNAGTDTHSVPATGLPTSTDNVEVRGSITGNSGSAPTVTNAAFFGLANNEISITVTGLCTFNDSSRNNGGITGNCTFNDSSSNIGATYGRINGNATFTNSSYTRDPAEMFDAVVITGTVTFSSPTPVTFTLSGGEWYSDTTEWIFTAPGPSWLFSGYGNNNRDTGVLTGSATFNDGAQNQGIVNGSATFNNNAENTRNWGTSPGTVIGNCTFNNAWNNGTVNGSATFTGTAANQTGVLNGSATFEGYTWSEGRINTTLDGTVGTVTFNDWSYNNAGWDMNLIDGDATFNDDSTNGNRLGTGTGLVTGNATFNDRAVCGSASDEFGNSGGSLGIVEGAARFALSAAARQMSAPRLMDAGSIEFIYDKGINGSSILGVI